jgi:hypothetical protein
MSRGERIKESIFIRVLGFLSGEVSLARKPVEILIAIARRSRKSIK